MKVVLKEVLKNTFPLVRDFPLGDRLSLLSFFCTFFECRDFIQLHVDL